jgi:GT2 family glycosyltransferase
LRVSIIILNYNGKIFLKDCLQSVLAQSLKDFEIIFVDNGSTDGSLDFVKQSFDDSRLKCFSPGENIGFAGGNNYGLKYSTGEYIVLLNNDTVVDVNWLQSLYDTINKDENTGAVQSLVITEGIPLKYYEINGTLNLFGHNIMEIFPIGEDGTGSIFQVTGCSLITKKKVLEDIGGLFLDEYFMYAEDSYFSFKLKFAGYNILHDSHSIVHHKGNATTNKFKNSFVTFYQERNRILNFLLFFSGKFLVKYFFLLILNLKIKLLYSIFSKKYSFTGILKSYLWFLKNIKWIKLQRKEIAKYKRVDEKEIIKLLSSKMSNENGLIDKVFNKISLIYCKLTGIKVIELSK